MRLGARVALSAALLAALTGLWLWASARRAEVSPQSFHSSGQCRACHERVYAEWESSHHRIAYTNPEVRALSDDYRKEECKPCHLPRPVAITGFGERTLARGTELDEGVNCLSCHLDADGAIMARRDIPGAPCRPKRDERFLSMGLCENCHNQHFTTDQWRASEFAKQGVDCNDCHMPRVSRTPNAEPTGRDHVFSGAHDLAMLRKAGVFEVRREGSELVLSLRNEGAGHNFPTEERHRAVDIVYRFASGKGEASDWTLAWRGRQPYRDESGENTQLPAGERKVVRVPIPPGSVRAEARLWYRLAPYLTDEDAKSFLLREEVLDL
ncbi:MAG: hypothetical protein Fur0037_25850 [Planctomycetota bacterium]